MGVLDGGEDEPQATQVAPERVHPRSNPPILSHPPAHANRFLRKNVRPRRPFGSDEAERLNHPPTLPRVRRGRRSRSPHSLPDQRPWLHGNRCIPSTRTRHEPSCGNPGA
jgi:hypothetical protein